MTRFRKLLLSVLLFPVFMGVHVPEEGESEPTPAAPTPPSEPQRPEDFPEDSWNTLAPHEKAAFAITDEMVEQEENDLTEEDLAAVVGDDEESTTTTTETPAETPTETTTETVQPATEKVTNLPTDEDLLAFRPTVSPSEYPTPAVVVPKEMQDKLDAVDTKIDELEAKFEDAEISSTEYRQQHKELAREREKLIDEKNAVLFDLKQNARDVARTEAENQKTEAAFHTARPEYTAKDDKGEFTDKADILYGALEKAVERVRAKHPHMPFMQQLVTADKQVREMFNLPVQGKAAAPAKPAEPEKPKPPAAPLPKEPSLRDMPTAGQHDEDPFAYIDRIKDPYQREQAMLKLTPTQLEAYERNASRRGA